MTRSHSESSRSSFTPAPACLRCGSTWAKDDPRILQKMDLLHSDLACRVLSEKPASVPNARIADLGELGFLVFGTDAPVEERERAIALVENGHRPWYCPRCAGRMCPCGGAFARPWLTVFLDAGGVEQECFPAPLVSIDVTIRRGCGRDGCSVREAWEARSL